MGNGGAAEEPQGAGEAAGGAGRRRRPRPCPVGDGLPEPAVPAGRRQGVPPPAPADAADAAPQGQRQRQDRRLRHPQGRQRRRQRVGGGAGPRGVGRPARVPAGAVPPGEHRHQGRRLPRAAVRRRPAGVPRRAARDQPRGVHDRPHGSPLQVDAAGGDTARGREDGGVPRARHLHGHAAAGRRHAAPGQGGAVPACPFGDLMGRLRPGICIMFPDAVANLCAPTIISFSGTVLSAYDLFILCTAELARWTYTLPGTSNL